MQALAAAFHPKMRVASEENQENHIAYMAAKCTLTKREDLMEYVPLPPNPRTRCED